MVEEVKAYKTTDNVIFENEKNAKKHQIEIDFDDGLKKLVEKHISYYDNEVMVFDFIKEHKIEIFNLLLLKNI